MPVGVSSLKNGMLSAVFHIPFVNVETAFEIHKLQGKTVILTIDSEDE